MSKNDTEALQRCMKKIEAKMQAKTSEQKEKQRNLIKAIALQLEKNNSKDSQRMIRVRFQPEHF